jgi:hypothetical protein
MQVFAVPAVGYVEVFVHADSVSFRPGNGKGKALSERCGIPPSHQKKGARMGHPYILE